MIKVKGCPFSIPKKGLRILWELTYRCNMRCKHCFVFENKQINQIKKEASLKDIKKIINKLENVKEVWLTGGEPLIKKDILKIIRYLNIKGISVSISTNGILLTKKMISELERFNVKYVHLSLDSVDKNKFNLIRGVSSFNKIVKAIGNLKKSKINYGVSCVITKNNHKNIDKIIEFCKKNKCSTVSFYPPLTYGRSMNNSSNLDKAELEKVFEKIKKHPLRNNMKIELIMFKPLSACKEICLGHRFLTINPYGELGPCPWYCKKDSQIFLPIKNFKKTKNIIEKSFKEKLKNKTNCPAL